MVAVKLDGNYIDAECMKSRKTSDLIKAYQNIHQRWKDSQVIHVNWHILENEAPRELKAAICSNGCTVELTPPDVHQRNNAERAIQTFKSHFISILAGVDNSFPINEWDSLIPQTILTLNLLHNANVAPKISAYAYHHGPFDYGRMPLAPIGCAVQFHVKPGRRRTWGEQSTDGWYIGASPEHYRTHRIFVKATRTHCLSDTVYFKHKYITQPTITPANAIVKAFQDLMATLKGTANLKGNQNMDAIAQLQRTLPSTVPHQPPAPRVTFQDTVQLRTFDPNGVTPLTQSAPTQLIVESPVTPAPPNTSPDITSPHLPIPRTTKPAADNTSIAARVALRQRTTPPATNDSIAARLLAR